MRLFGCCLSIPSAVHNEPQEQQVGNVKNEEGEEEGVPTLDGISALPKLTSNIDDEPANRPSKMSSMKLKRMSTGIYNKMQTRSTEFIADKLSLRRNSLSNEEKDSMVVKFKNIILNGGAEDNEEKKQVLVSKEDAQLIFEKLNVEIEKEVLDQLFAMFTIDASGTVDLQDLAVAFCFITCEDLADDDVELAFRLFDSSKSGKLSKQVINCMVSALIGHKLKVIRDAKPLEQAFTAFTQAEFSGELMAFLQTIEELRAKYSDKIPVDVAQALFDRFLQVDVEEQVNVSNQVREDCAKVIAESQDGMVPLNFLSKAEDETIKMLELGCLPRFKSRLKKSTEFVADEVWDHFSLGPDDGIQLEQFREWATDCSSLFWFFANIRSAVVIKNK